MCWRDDEWGESDCVGWCSVVVVVVVAVVGAGESINNTIHPLSYRMVDGLRADAVILALDAARAGQRARQASRLQAHTKYKPSDS